MTNAAVAHSDEIETGRTTAGTDSIQLRARFRTAVQSPLRAGLLRYLHARSSTAFDTDSLMRVFGRMRQDVDSCLHQLTTIGLVDTNGRRPERFRIHAAMSPQLSALLQEFAASDSGRTTEDSSPSVGRFREMIGTDEKMLLIFETIRTVAKTDLPVLILGPTGSGKEVVARMIHELSRRGAERLQAVNCAALPESLFESEVFGHEKGAFTGAHERRAGRIELAQNGTLFLDEIGDLSLSAQAKLLRVLEEHLIERLGGQRPIEVDFRLISATNQPLDVRVAAGKFREDLFYRINGFLIRLPSLRERPVDIPVLAERFLHTYCAAQGLPLDDVWFLPATLDLLSDYPWPGNIRELETTVSRAALMAGAGAIEPQHVQFLQAQAPSASGSGAAPSSLRRAERDHIHKILALTAWNKKRAARLLEISRETLYRKIADYGLKPQPETALDQV